MKKTSTAILCMLMLFYATYLPAQLIDAEICNTHEWEWATSIQTSDYYGRASEIKVDTKGNVYVTGRFDDTVTLGDSVYTNIKGGDFYVAKYNAMGVLVWSSHYAVSSYYINLNIITDAYDNLYIMGEFSDTLEIDGDALISNENEDIFIFKYNSFSTLEWARQYGGKNKDISGDIKADQLGNVYITGTFQTTTEIGDYTINSNDGSDYLLRLNSDGSVGWLKQFGNSVTWGTSLAINSNNDLILSGVFEEAFTIESTTLEAPTGSMPGMSNAIFLAELSATGNLEWLKTAVTGNTSSGVLEVDKSNDIYIGGHFYDYAPEGLSVGDSLYFGFGGYIAKFDADGNAQWSRRIADDRFNYVSSIAVDAHNNLYTSGLITSTIDFANQTYAGFGGYLAKYSPDGAELKLWQTGDFSYDRADFICSDANGKIYSTGAFQEPVTFGNTTLSATNETKDIFLACLGPQASTQATEPDVAATRIRFSNFTSNSVDISWGNGDGQSRIVLVKKLGIVHTSGVDDGSYYEDGDGVFGAGSQTGQRTFVVYNGSGNQATVSGLDPMKLYSFTVIEYNEDLNCLNSINYKTSQNKTSFLLLPRRKLFPDRLSVAPNPVADMMNITLSTSEKGNKTIYLLNSYGFPVRTFHIKLKEDVTQLSYDLSRYNLRPGIYYLKANVNGLNVVRIIKQ